MKPLPLPSNTASMVLDGLVIVFSILSKILILNLILDHPSNVLCLFTRMNGRWAHSKLQKQTKSKQNPKWLFYASVMITSIIKKSPGRQQTEVRAGTDVKFLYCRSVCSWVLSFHYLCMQIGVCCARRRIGHPKIKYLPIGGLSRRN